MNKHELHQAFAKIEPKPQVKERIYWAVQREAKDGKLASKKKLSFFRKRIDRFVPYAAVFVILLFGLSFWGVSSGFLTGGMSPQGEDPTGVGRAAPQNDTPVAQESPAPVATQEEDAPALLHQATPQDLRVYAAFDVGFTVFEIAAVPGDAQVLWAEMQRLGAAPKSVSLHSSTLEGDSLTLDFSSTLQDLMDASATHQMITGFAKTFRALYPDCTTLAVLSEGTPLTVGGKALDATPLMDEAVSITDTKHLRYQEEITP